MLDCEVPITSQTFSFSSTPIDGVLRTPFSQRLLSLVLINHHSSFIASNESFSPCSAPREASDSQSDI